MTSPRIDKPYHESLKADPERYLAALSYIVELRDFQPHPIDTHSQLFSDVRAVMFFEVECHWRIGLDDVEVYNDKLGGKGNEASFTAAVEEIEDYLKFRGG